MPCRHYHSPPPAMLRDWIIFALVLLASGVARGGDVDRAHGAHAAPPHAHDRRQRDLDPQAPLPRRPQAELRGPQIPRARRTDRQDARHRRVVDPIRRRDRAAHDPADPRLRRRQGRRDRLGADAQRARLEHPRDRPARPRPQRRHHEHGGLLGAARRHAGDQRHPRRPPARDARRLRSSASASARPWPSRPRRCATTSTA